MDPGIGADAEDPRATCPAACGEGHSVEPVIVSRMLPRVIGWVGSLLHTLQRKAPPERGSQRVSYVDDQTTYLSRRQSSMRGPKSGCPQ